MPEILLVPLGVLVLLSPLLCLLLQFGMRRRLGELTERNLKLDQRVLDLESILRDEQVRKRPSIATPSTPSGTAATAPAAPAVAHAPRQPIVVQPAAVQRQAVPVTPVPHQVSDDTPRPSLEVFLGGRVMLVVGVIVVLFGLAFFLKVAIDKGWIGPAARIVMGVTAGLALLLSGDRLRARGLDVFGHALMGGGLGALYLSNYFATTWFGFLGRDAAFVLVAGVTALGAWLAVLREARLLAWLGFLGAFLAPALLGRNEDALGELTAWLVVVDLGLLAVLVRRSWPRLEVMALGASTLYYWAWSNRWLHPAVVDGGADRSDVACLALSALLGALLALCLVPTLVRKGRLSSTALATMLVGSLLAFGAGHDLLFPAARGVLGAAVLTVGAVYVLAGWWLARRRDASREEESPDTDVLDAFGLVALTVAIPVLLSGDALTPSWALAGGAAVYAGSRMQRLAFQFGGLGMVLLATLHVLTDQLPLHEQAFVPLMNLSFLSAVSPCAALLLSARFLRKSDMTATLPIRTPLLLSGAWLFALLLAVELYDHFILASDIYGAASRDDALSAAAVGLAMCSVVFAILFGRGTPRLPVASAVPLLFALLAAAVVNVDGVRPAFSPVLNVPVGAGLLVTVAAVAVGRLLAGELKVWATGAALLCLLVLITSELHTYGRLGVLDTGTREEARFRAQVYISVAWGLYAAVLLTLGFLRDRKELRWAALMVFALTLGKVVLMDMARLETVYRIGSFLAVGGLLVAASFLYQRARTPIGKPTSTPKDPPT